METLKTTENKIKVPKLYYQEMSKELAKTWIDAKKRPKMQKDRIIAVLESGKDFEIMGSYEIPLKKLVEYYSEALKVDVAALKQKWVDFRSTHEIDPKMKENLKGAKEDAKEFLINNPLYNDEDNNYNLLHKLGHKYYLSDKNYDKLMEYFMKINLL